MVRKAASVLLILVILSSGFTKFFIYAGYTLNKKYIAVTLCVNKANLAMHCNGKCYLAKKIKEADKEEKKQQQAASKHIFNEALYSQTKNFKCFVYQIDEFLSLYSPPVSSTHIAVIIQPPQNV